MIEPPPVAPKVSIAIATYGRCSRLQRCIAAIRANVTISHEIVIVGNGVGDGTESWLNTQPGIRFIRETNREGATRAYNKAFRATKGHYVTWLNDDAYPLPGALDSAVRMIEHPNNSDIGMVAFYHNFNRNRNRLHSVEHEKVVYSMYNVRGLPYANFGLLRRDLLVRLGYLDERYYFCAWDPDLSLKVQHEAGLSVVGCPDAKVYHEEYIDQRKRQDMKVMDDDNRKLFEKWGLPEKFSYPDPGPQYRKTLAERLAAMIVSPKTRPEAPVH
ncbi:MAG: glycosyltransferase [Phycisphaerales bacterium]|nr:glycosyltransferase [Phycisphaerales bacterium]